MISFIDTTDLKNKFAELLSELYYSSKLTLEQISDSLTYDKRFLFLEKNKADDFMSTPNSVLIKDIFNAEMMFESDKNNPVYWAGLQYMTLSFNYLIPLNQLFLLCPLKEMVAHFTIYHEMHPIKLCNEFINNEYKRSILKAIREDKGLSLSQLSSLASIPLNSLKYYEKSNDALFNASMTVINKLIEVLDVDASFFKRKSSFIPLSINLLDDSEFKKELATIIGSFYYTKELKIDNIINKDEKKIKENTLYIGTFNQIIIDNKTVVIGDLLLLPIIKHAIEICLSKIDNQLYF